MSTAPVPNVAATDKPKRERKESDFIPVEVRTVYLHKSLAPTSRPDLSAGMQSFADAFNLKVRNVFRSRNGGSGRASTYIAPMGYTFPSEKAAPTGVRVTDKVVASTLRARAEAAGMTVDELIASLLR